MTIHKIYLTNMRYGRRGILYDAEYNDEVIVNGSEMPFLDACRVLQDRGVSGEAELWDRVRPHPRMRGTIRSAASLTVSESGGTAAFRKWRSFGAGSLQGGDSEVGS